MDIIPTLLTARLLWKVILPLFRGQEMLLKSHKGYIDVFPAIPESWKNVSFTKLRSQGAFLISATKENGALSEVKIFSEKGGLLKLKLPSKNFHLTETVKQILFEKDVCEIEMKAGEEITIKMGTRQKEISLTVQK